MTEFGQRLKMIRKSSGKSQTDLANSIGVTKQAISNYESGAEASTDKLVAIAKYFSVSTDFLLGISSNPDERQRDERLELQMLSSDLIGEDAVIIADKIKTMTMYLFAMDTGRDGHITKHPPITEEIANLFTWLLKLMMCWKLLPYEQVELRTLESYSVIKCGIINLLEQMSNRVIRDNYIRIQNTGDVLENETICEIICDPIKKQSLSAINSNLDALLSTIQFHSPLARINEEEIKLQDQRSLKE